MLQATALVAFALMLLALLADGKLLNYEPIYEKTEVNPAEIEAKCAHLSDDPNDAADNAFTRWNPELKVSPRETCLTRERQPRIVGEALAGVDPKALTFVLILLLLAFLVPFALVRVPTWLLEGWRKGR